MSSILPPLRHINDGSTAICMCNIVCHVQLGYVHAKFLPTQVAPSFCSIRPEKHKHISVPFTSAHLSLHGLVGPQGVPEVEA